MPSPGRKNTTHKFAIAIHGGAGTILKKFMTPEKLKAYTQGLTESLQAGFDVLERGGAALDAVQAAVVVMEDNPLFNAGKGAVFTHEGTHEQDACIMDGATKNVGAVAAVRKIANPIKLARLVMDNSPHVLLSGEGAERFAALNGVPLIEDPQYFFTEHRHKQYQQALKREKQAAGQAQTQLDHSDDKDKVGTVGAVALDVNGNLAAATSTGGMTNKRFGRIGDTPMIGAGTYANETCAISATGVGEYIMRAMLAYDIAALMAYKNMTLQEAVDLVVMKKFAELGGSGGAVAIDREGNIAMPFNSAGMYRGYMLPDGTIRTAVFKE
jgi:beta-aspartyl-peptidase (threonine type)